jgi:DNA-binding GntR family transcriptional regulator
MADTLTEPIVARSLVDTLAKRLEDAIISGELVPGERLSEPALAKSLGVSRGPLREALIRLQARKLIERTPNHGARVAALSRDDLIQILVVREALEGMACRMATVLMTDREIQELEDLLERHAEQKPLQRGEAYFQESGDFDFHYKIAEGSRNKRLIDLLCGDLYDLLRIYRYRSSARRGRARHSLVEHKAIVEAIRSRDPDRAEALMRQHIRNARDNLAADLGESFEKAPGKEDHA